MVARARSFGEVAAAYERYRPGYPPAVADLVLDYAGAPVGTALEIGAGTGKATRLFVTRGIAVTATEPDPAMVAELRRQVPAAQVHTAALEDLPSVPEVDLVYAAASLHWTTAAGRWQRIARLLRPGGVFAAFGGPVELADPALAQAVRRARARHLDGDDVPAPDGTPPDAPLQWPGTELEDSALFGDVRQHRVARPLRWDAAAYVGYLGTVSAYLQLSPGARAEVFARTLEVLPAEVDVTADLIVHLARRR